MTSPTNIVAGNWKMNTDLASGVELASAVAAGVVAVPGVRVIIAPPFVALAAVRDALTGSGVAVAAQNMHADDSGAFTGEIAPPMLVGLCDYVIIGHSERRQFFGETDESVGRKAAAALCSTGCAPSFVSAKPWTSENPVGPQRSSGARSSPR